jgi:xanthine dehydrogenase accessory factor
MRELVLVRGGGDLATGTIYRLYQAGFRVLILEAAAPTAIRREAAFCEAVRLGTMTVEGVTARRVDNVNPGKLEECCGRLEQCWDAGEIPLIIDEEAASAYALRPQVLVDAIIAKRNIGTNRGMAPFVVALGPGFKAGNRDDPDVDVDVVIETMRGHDLGRLIYKGSAAPNTGVPGLIAGEGIRRVVHAPAAGVIMNISAIGDMVEEGQIIARIMPEGASLAGVPVRASLSGVLRGIIQDGFSVWKGMKIADIDPRREQQKNCRTISDKARALGGSVLEAIDHYLYG